MEWLRAHPYVLALIIAILLLGGGAFIVENRSPISPESTNITWGSGAPLSAYQEPGGTQSPQQIAQDVVQGQAENVTVPTLTASSSQSVTPTPGTFDYTALLAQLSASYGGTPSSSSGVQGSSTITESYQLIPNTLVATTTSGALPMTTQQLALYEYGNEVGGEIESFEQLHTDEADVIKDQAEDRTDPTKAAAVVSLGQALASVGTFMQQMQEVPPSVQPLHAALAQSYLSIGVKLQLVPQAQTDAQFVQAVENYDSAANTFVQNYAALATFFSAQGVTFSEQDPGSVFSFTDSSAGAL